MMLCHEQCALVESVVDFPNHVLHLTCGSLQEGPRAQGLKKSNVPMITWILRTWILKLLVDGVTLAFLQSSVMSPGPHDFLKIVESFLTMTSALLTPLDA